MFPEQQVIICCVEGIVPIYSPLHLVKDVPGLFNKLVTPHSCQLENDLPQE